MYFVWFDGDRRRGPHLKLTDAINAYFAKYDRHPVICLASHQDAGEIISHSRRPAITIRGAEFISRNNYYLGDEEELAAMDEVGSCAA